MSSKAVAAVSVVVALVVAGALWAHSTVAPLPYGTKADRLVVEKSARRLSAYAGATLLRSYTVSLGRVPVGPKTREGDKRTPEGQYIIDRHNPSSGYHLALHVSYPSPTDVAQARSGGYAPGGEIMIHGMRNGFGWLGRAHQFVDWTVGCMAVTDSEIEELYRVVPDGTPIEIRP